MNSIVKKVFLGCGVVAAASLFGATATVQAEPASGAAAEVAGTPAVVGDGSADETELACTAAITIGGADPKCGPSGVCASPNYWVPVALAYCNHHGFPNVSIVSYNDSCGNGNSRSVTFKCC